MTVLVTWLSLYVSQVMDYEKELKIMENLTKEEYLASLRRCILPLEGENHFSEDFFRGLKSLQFKF